jgi:hypothetical protein
METVVPASETALKRPVDLFPNAIRENVRLSVGWLDE